MAAWRQKTSTPLCWFLIPSLFVNQEHVAPIAAEIDPALRFKPMTRCESALRLVVGGAI